MTIKLPDLHIINGIKIGTANAGIKQQNSDDLALFELPPQSTCAAVFTRNAFCAAPVTIARQHLATTTPRFLLINSGNANAGMGECGLKSAKACCAAVAKLTGCDKNAVLPFSTGVIGTSLPVEKIQAALPTAVATLNTQGWEKAAQAIMTTDTVPKAMSKQLLINNQLVTITGITKGAGMIRPDMATMLAFIATDAKIESTLLQTCLKQAMAGSFNRISIDGDTSTNDACVLVATGHGSLVIDNSTDNSILSQFSAALIEVCLELAQAIVRDGEGATKFITISVEQGALESECFEVAYTIAHSPLVKTAFFASDANWGRILAAVGRVGIKNFDISAVQIYLDDVCIVQNGGVAETYTEELGQAVMNQPEILVRILLGRGSNKTIIYTCDLSQEYVRINAEYRT